jgi:cyclopropane fatty-acyl-phospholipid synthase-like methyltransferase
VITHDRIPEYYDWLSRYVQVANWLSYRDRFASFTMHKRLAPPGDASPTAGLEYVNERLLDVAAPAQTARVLDAGCGFGGTVFHWQGRAGGRYDGLTLSRVQLDVARREAHRRGVDDVCRFHLRSYDELLEPEYDVVVAIESLIHSRDLTWTLPNLARGLRPGGVLVVLDDMAETDLDRARPAEAALLRDHWGCARYPTHADYRDAITRSGLSLVHEEDLSPLVQPRPPDGLDRMEHRFAKLHRTIPVAPVRTIISAYLGGIALERLHGSGDVHYRLLVARNGAACNETVGGA